MECWFFLKQSIYLLVVYMCIDSIVSIEIECSSKKYWKCHFLIIKFSEINSYCTKNILRLFFLSDNTMYKLAFFKWPVFIYINMSILIVSMYYKLYSYLPINNTIQYCYCWYIPIILPVLLSIADIYWRLCCKFWFINSPIFFFYFSFTVHQYSCLYNAYVI